MIAIDTELVYLTKYYELNTRRANQKAYASIDSYTDDYATKKTSGTNSTTDTNNINTGDADLDAILKALKLYVPENRFSVLLKMKREDLLAMLILLDKDQLAMGIKYFSKDKIVNYISSLPKEDILKIISKLFSKEELLSMIPINDLNKFLDNANIEPGELMNLLKSLPQNVLAQTYEAVTGESSGKMTYDNFIDKFKQTDPKQIMEGFKSLPYRELLNVINKLTDNNPKLMKQFSVNTLCTPLLDSAKSKIVEGMKVLNPEQLMKLVGQLPDKLLANVETLIDPNKLSEILLKTNKDLLISLVA